MYFIFADDSTQNHPTRDRMGPLVAIGGICVFYKHVSLLEEQLNALCSSFGFPADESFKWSPRRDQWMYNNLVKEGRQTFFIRVIQLLRDFNTTATVIIEDINCETAIDSSPDAQTDVTSLFIERAHHQLAKYTSQGIIIADRPGGGRRDEEHFLYSCLETIQSGTTYVNPERIALNVLSTPSKLIRLLQCADLIASCTVSFVSGEANYSQHVFEEIKPMLNCYCSRIAGVGLKLHPDYKYRNLYYWLLGEDIFWKGDFGLPLPKEGYPYLSGADVYV